MTATRKKSPKGIMPLAQHKARTLVLPSTILSAGPNCNSASVPFASCLELVSLWASVCQLGMATGALPHRCPWMQPTPPKSHEATEYQ